MTGILPGRVRLSVGDPVNVIGRGPGIVFDVRGGPVDVLYVVFLYGLDLDTGLPTSHVCEPWELAPGDPLLPFSLGDPVRVTGRTGHVVALADRGGVEHATVMVPADPVEGLGEVSEPRRFDMPVWKLHLLQQC